MLDRLLDLDVIVCAGSGGVGKTTMSSTLGVWAAQQGKKVLVLTIDPAKRLANALGLDSSELNKPGQVQGLKASGELHASMIDSQEIFDSFIRKCAPNEQAAERLFANSLYKQLSTTLSGSQEFTSLEALLQAKESGNYDLIILDTPPSQHAIDFLRAPERIFALFQKSITQWFIKGSGDVGLFRKLVNQGTKTALSALEAVTGSKFIQELSDFFESMAELQDEVGQRSIQVHRLLSSERTGFVLITGFDRAKLVEAEKFQRDLRTAGASLSLVLVNRAKPASYESLDMKTLSSEAQNTAQKIDQLKKRESEYFQIQTQFLEELEARLSSSTNMLCLPEVIDDIVGAEGLELLVEILKVTSSQANQPQEGIGV
ncbi:MAG: ArsA family ATPase [Bdellovibrionales bacterium]|nr:ArsA family ATPase [Bdellovibrionales bacterium]